MRKLISLLLALAVVFSLGLTVYAADGDATSESKPTGSELPEVPRDSMTEVTLHLEYKSIGSTATSPAQTFTFTVTPGWTGENGELTVTDSTATTCPAFTQDTVNVQLPAGAATVAGTYYPVTFTLPTYTAVGKYYYTVNQTTTDKYGGVTVDADPIQLVVTVMNAKNANLNDTDFEGFVVAAVHAEGDTGDKTWFVENTYEANSLNIKKLIAGNMADENKEFDVDVYLTGEANKTYAQSTAGNDIAVSSKAGTIGGADSTSVKINDNNTTTTKITFKIKHNETITISNIPKGVQYKIAEADYTDENGGYDAAVYRVNDAANLKLDGTDTTSTGWSADLNTISATDNTENVTIVNHKEVEVDTGVILDSAPYVLLLVVAVIGLALFLTRKRANRES